MPTTVPEQNFQPQTRDTTTGPNVHTYIPRQDGSILVGGVAYVPQVAVPAAAAATAVPVAAAAPSVQFPYYPMNFPYYIYQQSASFST